MRIRQGNDFIFLWAIERNGEPEDFSNAVNIRLHFKKYDCVGEVKSFQIVNGNIVRVEVTPEWASRLGDYRLILSYEFENQSYSDGDQKCVVDVLAFNIVPKTSEADDVTEMAKTTDIMIGLKGDKGDPFTYDDFTPEQIEDLKRPAIEAAESVQIVENQISINEQGRVQAENERETAETARESAETIRITNEDARTSAEILRAQNENTREDKEQTRIENENLRIIAEEDRNAAESVRISNENGRITAETDRSNAENIRQTNETERANNEITRQEAETERISNEQIRQDNEETRKTNEIAREQLKGELITLKEETETAKLDAIDAAENANTAADTANTAVAELLRPVEMKLDYPDCITYRNTYPKKINYILYPQKSVKNMLFLGDENAVSVRPNGELYVKKPGTSIIHCIPVENTAIYETIQIQVIEPDLRVVNSNSLRLMANGFFRLT